MKLATIRLRSGGGTETRAVRLEADRLIDLGVPDVGTLLADPSWETTAREAEGPAYDVEDADLPPVVPNPSKVICVGHGLGAGTNRIAGAP